MYTIFDSFLIEQKYAEELHASMLEEGKKYFAIDCIVREKINAFQPIDDQHANESELDAEVDAVCLLSSDKVDCVDCDNTTEITDDQIESIIKRIFERSHKRLEDKMPIMHSRIRNRLNSMVEDERQVAFMSMPDAWNAGRITEQSKVDNELRLSCEDLLISA